MGLLRAIRCVVVAALVPRCSSTGKGPVGIYAIDARYVVIADSNFNALLVVDAKLGGAVGALSWPLDKNGTRVTAASDPQTWVSLTGVASCPTCGFAYVTSNHGAEFWRVSLPEPLAAMAARRDFAGLGNASVAPLALVVDGANLTHSGKLRMARVSADGSAGYVAHLSRGVFAFDPRRTGAAMPVKRILEADGAAGLQFADDENELLATTMGAVLVLKTRNASAAPRAVKVQSACNGHHARDAVKADGLFYVISGPQQGAGCKGLFEVGVSCNHDVRSSPERTASTSPSPSTSMAKTSHCEACRLLTARTRSVNWVDGPYSAAHFSRPHAMTRLPGTDLIALTDIDNRAVRLYAFRGPAKGEVTTVPYDDGLWRRLLGGAPRPRPARPQVGAAAPRARDGGAAAEACAARGLALCGVADLAASDAWARDLRRAGTTTTTTTATALAAKATARARDFLGLGAGAPGDAPAAPALWTSQRCASCWLHWPGECAATDHDKNSKSYTKATWGHDRRLLARAERDGALRYECRDAAKPALTADVCC